MDGWIDSLAGFLLWQCVFLCALSGRQMKRDRDWGGGRGRGRGMKRKCMGNSMSQQPDQVQYDIIWTECIHIYTHTYKGGLTCGVMGVIGYQLGNVISWSAATDIHIVQISVCVCVCVCGDLVSGGCAFYMMWQKKMTNMWGDSLYPEKHPSGPLCVCWGYCKFWGFIALDGRQLTNNKLNNCELIKKKVIYILQLASSCKKYWVWEEVSVSKTFHCNKKYVFFFCCFFILSESCIHHIDE